MKPRLLFSLVVAVGAVLVNWLILGDSSPLHQYFLRHGSGIEDFWLALNFLPVLLAAIVSRNPGGGDELLYAVLVFIQWFTIAFMVSSFLFKVRRKLFATCLMWALLCAAGCSPRLQGAAGPENASGENAAQQSVKTIVLENERKIWEAFKARDANAVRALLADDVQVVTVNGRFDKAAFLRIIPQLPEITSYTISNATVTSPSKDVAILTYDSRFVTKEPRLTTHSSFQTTIWVNRGGNWIAVFNQETPR
jgi:hypothetical protein